MTNTPANPIVPSQGAREAAAQWSDVQFSAFWDMPLQPTEWDKFRSGVHDASEVVQAFARFEATIRAEARAVPLNAGEWWYPEGDTSSDECRDSPDEVIDYAIEGHCPDDGANLIVAIERAAQLPTVYATVHIFTDEEKDVRGLDDDYDYTLYPSSEQAKAALITPQVQK